MGNEGQFPIKITGDASSLVAATQQTNAALDSTKIKLAELTPEQKATTAAMSGAGQAAQDAGTKIEEGGKQAAKAGLSHRELRVAAHGLAMEFPLLGHLASLAIHPIGIVVAAAASAFAIFKYRVDEATRSMTAFVLPDLDEQKIGRVNAMATAWNSFKEAFEGAVKGYNSVGEAADRAMKKMETQLEQQKKLLEGSKALELANLERDKASMSEADYVKSKLSIEDRYAAAGLKGDEYSKQAKISGEYEKAMLLQQDADRKLKESAGIKVPSPDDEASLTASYQKNADAAKAGREEHEDWLTRIAAWQDKRMLPHEAIKFGAQFEARYGPGITGTQAMGFERSEIREAEMAMAINNKWLAGKSARDEARKRKFGLSSEAGVELGQANILIDRAGDEAGDYAAEVGTNRKLAGMASAARVATALGRANDQAKEMMQQMLKTIEAGYGISAESLQRVKEVQALQAELQKELKRLRGSPARTY